MVNVMCRFRRFRLAAQIPHMHGTMCCVWSSPTPPRVLTFARSTLRRRCWRNISPCTQGSTCCSTASRVPWTTQGTGRDSLARRKRASGAVPDCRSRRSLGSQTANYRCPRRQNFGDLVFCAWYFLGAEWAGGRWRWELRGILLCAKGAHTLKRQGVHARTERLSP